jgi:hypothetical protein
MSTETLTKLLADVNATEYAERKARAKLQDETKFFNEPRAQADHDVWSKMPFWALDKPRLCRSIRILTSSIGPISGRMYMTLRLPTGTPN